MKTFREELATKLYNDLPSELGKYKRHIDVIKQIESALIDYGNQKLEEAAMFLYDLSRKKPEMWDAMEKIRALKEKL